MATRETTFSTEEEQMGFKVHCSGASRSRRVRCQSVALVVGLLVISALAVSPIGAAAKTSPILAQSEPVNITVSDPPPNHGSVFPVTISGQLVYWGTVLKNHKLKGGSKIAKTARARCSGPTTLPLSVKGYSGGNIQDPSTGVGSTITDSLGAFSGTVQLNTVTPQGNQVTYYQGYVQIVKPILTKTAGKIEGHPVRCLVGFYGNIALRPPHTVT